MSEPSRTGADVSETDWIALLDRSLAGDRVAYARMVRLVTNYLARWRAFDFHADWDDIVQEVLLSTVTAHREGRLESPGGLVAYVRQAARFKFIDRIRAHQRRPTDDEEPDALADAERRNAAWPPVDGAATTGGAELRGSLGQAIAALPDRERAAVFEVHVCGRTYEEAAETTGIPLGSLKRALRTGLAELRRVLDEPA